ncbi:MAG TPA: hypothetical protein DCZ80_01730, partial [Legionellales bacterium]|nr:hypothetical protein [Legionellales bacterium]
NTVDLGNVVVAEQASPVVSSNSFFKVMTSDTAKLVAASISLFAGAALTAFLCVTGMASIALAALAAALIIMSAACIAILMKNKTSAPVCAM